MQCEAISSHPITFQWEKAAAAMVDGAVSCTGSVPSPLITLYMSSGQLSAFRLKTITSPADRLLLSPDDKCSLSLCHLSRPLAQVKALKLSLFPMSFLWSTEGVPIPIFSDSPTSSLSCTETLLSQSYFPIAADSCVIGVMRGWDACCRDKVICWA